ncbi:aminopeptidase P family protein [Candidatus Woesearchaeota archaeon]|nr:aminopeptidase P family protein [Candidatus Woesearchaeota archaeon]
MQDTSRKINLFITELIKNKIDAALIYNLANKDKHLYYLTGLDIEYCFLLILAGQKKVIVYTSILESERVKNILPYEVVVINKPISRMINYQLKKEKIKKLAVNFNCMIINEYNKFKKVLNTKMIDCSDILTKIRQQKTKQEQEFIKKACEITDKVFTEILNNFKNFKTEQNIADFIRQRFYHYNVTESFPTIIASGKNAAIPHYLPKDIPLNNGFCIIDFGCKYKEYCSDMTRTVFIGKPTAKQIKLYKTVLSTKKAAEFSIRLNKRCSTAEKAARKELGILQKKFIHGLGHGVGLDVHESPNISCRSKDIFLENAVFTIEPGIYFSEELGIRIEDDYIITKNGLEKLTKSTEQLMIIQ